MTIVASAKRLTIVLLRRTPPALTRRIPFAALRLRALRLHAEVLRVAPIDFGRADTRFGFSLGGSTADLLQRSVYVFGMWEPNISRWVRTHLRPGDVVVDVGANVGYFSLLSATCTGPSGRVIAFEPVPSIVKMLHGNLQLNGFENVTVEHAIAADEPGVGEIFRGAEGNLGMSTTAGHAGMRSEGEVPQVRGADAIDQELWPSVRLVKVDTEGDDLRALRGLEPLLRAMPAGSAALVEITPDELRTRSDTPDQLVALMRLAGFDRMLTVANSYAVEDYADDHPQSPVPIEQAPTTKADVIFLKATRAT